MIQKMPVWEITGAEFTKHDAHTAGISVRFPRVTRVRDDKSYKEATNLQELRVIMIFQSMFLLINLGLLL
jgi:DNA ligase-3